MRRTEKGRKVAIVVLAAVGLLVFCLFRSASVEAVYPVERARRAFVDKIWARIRGMAKASETAAENVRLKREVASLVMEHDRYERCASELLRLKRILGYAETLPGKWIAAPVLSRDGGAVGMRKTLRIGKGLLAGVDVGAIVSSPDGLVGKVVAVSPHTAEVLLITDVALKVACTIEGERGANAILSGGTDDLLVLRHFTVGAEIPTRARVFTSGLGGVFPGGIEVGTLIDVRGDVGDLAREGEVQPSVDFSTLEDVFIIASGESSRHGADISGADNEK